MGIWVPGWIQLTHSSVSRAESKGSSWYSWAIDQSYRNKKHRASSDRRGRVALCVFLSFLVLQLALVGAAGKETKKTQQANLPVTESAPDQAARRIPP